MKDAEEMEMPCQCDCGNWFEHGRGFISDRRTYHGYKMICEECHEREEKENED